MSKTIRKLFAQVYRPAVFIGGLALLTLTWFFLFLWLAAMTEGWLAPWDVAPGRPPLGTLARSLNDFFEGAPGVYLPAALVIIVSAGLFMARLSRSGDKTWLPLEFAAENVAFVLAVGILANVAHQLPNLWLPQPRPAMDVGYHRTWPGLVVMATLLFVLLRVQYKGVTPSTSNRLEHPRQWLMWPALLVGGIIFALPYLTAASSMAIRTALAWSGVAYGWPTALSALPFIPIYLTAQLFTNLERYLFASAVAIGLTLAALMWARPAWPGRIALALTLLAIVAFPFFFAYQPALVAAPGRTMHVLMQPGLLEGVVKRAQSIVEIRPCAYTLLGWSDDNTLYYQEQCGEAAALTLAFKPGRDAHPWIARLPDQSKPLPELIIQKPATPVFELVRAPGVWPECEEPNTRRIYIQNAGMISPDGRWVALIARHVYGAEDVLIVELAAPPSS